MSSQAAYKLKVEAEIELAQAKLAELKAHAKNTAADARIKLEGMIYDLERMLDGTKTKLRELGTSGEGAWDELKDGVDVAWSEFSKGLGKAAAKFRN